MSLEEYNSFELEKVLVELSIVDVTLNLSNLDSIAIDGDESFELVQIEGCESQGRLSKFGRQGHLPFPRSLLKDVDFSTSAFGRSDIFLGGPAAMAITPDPIVRTPPTNKFEPRLLPSSRRGLI
jgi:hypothetical protein